MTRLEILEQSLAKKQKRFDDYLQYHFDTVKQANGQPLNDKRNGSTTLNKWERQNDTLRRMQADIERTQAALRYERGKITDVEAAKSALPREIVELIEAGTLTQWRKYPNTLFVVGVEKARIVWDAKQGKLFRKYTDAIPDAEQRRRFAEVYNPLCQIFNV